MQGAATKFGTAAFVASLKDGAEVGADTGAATATDSMYRPKQETSQGWTDYVHGLLNGVRYYTYNLNQAFNFAELFFNLFV